VLFPYYFPYFRCSRLAILPGTRDFRAFGEKSVPG
jgi:hypothetical protein